MSAVGRRDVVHVVVSSERQEKEEETRQELNSRETFSREWKT